MRKARLPPAGFSLLTNPDLVEAIVHQPKVDVKEVRNFFCKVSSLVYSIARDQSVWPPPTVLLGRWHRDVTISSHFQQPYGFDLINCQMMGFAGLRDARKNPADESWVDTSHLR
jgi:hypothetical protein